MLDPKSSLIKAALAKTGLTRRDFLKLGLSGAALSCLDGGCQVDSPTQPGDHDEPVSELTDGRTLYDDFDGNGCLQTYNGQNLAEAGQLSSKIWDFSNGTEIVPNPVAAGLLNVVNEDGQRVKYIQRDAGGGEIQRIFDADGKLLQAVPHVPGQPYHSSRKIFWLGARDGYYEYGNGRLAVKRGKVYGSAQLQATRAGGWVLRLDSRLPGLLGCFLDHPKAITFLDFKTISADVMLPSTATAPDFYAALDYHTTIPEQPPGKSWTTDIGIRRYPTGEAYLFAQCVNVNSGGYLTFMHLGRAQLDTWYNLRMDIVTQRDDPSLKANEFRIDYYVNGTLRETEIPLDAELLLDPTRTGWGPHRLLVVFTEQATGECLGFFDNIKAVYRDRIN